MYKLMSHSWIKHLDFILLDLVCMQISLLIAYLLRYGSLPSMSWEYKYWGVFLVLMHFCIVFFTECYSGVLRRGYLQRFKSVLKYNLILVSGMLAFLFFTKQSYEYSRFMLFIFFMVNCILMYIFHVMLKNYIVKAAKAGKNSEYLLLITKKAMVQDNVERLLTNEYSALKLKGIVIIDEDMTGHSICGVPVVTSFENLFEFAKKSVVDEVLLNVRDVRIEELTNKFLEMGITVHINIDRISRSMPNAVVEEINGFTVVTTSINTVTTRQIVLKRSVDIAAGTVGMLAASVAYIIFAPIIYIQSPGPIFFSQVRVGRNGRRFKIYKFRSMYMDAEERKKELMSQNKMSGLMFKMDNDPRVIPIGRFLRSTSIDELPQFFNILKGDMSLVGTRPPTYEEYMLYDYHHKSRLAAKPGLTGMWQVSGRSNITDFEEVVALDTEYIKNWSLGLDLKIIFKTALVVLGRVGSV